MKMLQMIAALICAVGSVIWAITDTPPRRAAIESRHYDLEIEKQKTEQERIKAEKEKPRYDIVVPSPWGNGS